MWQAFYYNSSKFGSITIAIKAHIYSSFALYFSHIFHLIATIPTTDFLARSPDQLTTIVATLCEQKKNLTLSLSTEDTRRWKQNPTGDPHLSDLSSQSSCNHGPRRHRRAQGASSPSPRWEHVARRPHTPGKSPGCCWSCASDCSSLVMRVSDWGVWGELTPSESTGHADRHAVVWKACGQVPHEQGGVSPIEFARLSSVRDGILTSSTYCSEVPRNVSDRRIKNGMVTAQSPSSEGDGSFCAKPNVRVIYVSTD